MQPPSDRIAEGQRLLTICNACRYCEGFCAVFPAMERRMTFTPADVKFLANLCHNCAECYYACQYAPPHEFAVNVPQVFAQIRAETYAESAVPAQLWGSSWAAWLIGVVVVTGLTFLPTSGEGFYAVIPQLWMTGTFLLAGLAVALGLIAGAARFWRASGPKVPWTLWSGLRDALTLKNLSSHGAGCTYPGELHSDARRRYHHLTFYGFLLCFASTSVAAVYHYVFGWEAPYPYLSAPVILGTLGGVGLVIGPVGLWSLKRKRDLNIVDVAQDGMDLTFLASLFLTSVTGLALLVLRGTNLMPTLLVVHLAIVLGLFLTLPYGKFVHGIYRTLSLLRDAGERSVGL